MSEWDWPPKGRPSEKIRQESPFGDRGTGWASPGAKAAVSVYWRVTIGILKVLVAIPIAAVTVWALWMLAVILTGP